MASCIDRGLQAVITEKQEIREHVKEIHRSAATLDPSRGDSATRQRRFQRLRKRLGASGDPVRLQLAVVMAAFLVGLFAGSDVEGLPVDNLDLERWFRRPKGHERRIHGHRHVGVRIVQEGATLVLVLDAHVNHPAPFTAIGLVAYRGAKPPLDEQEAVQRRKVMRKARSKKKRRLLLAELEQRYLDGS